MDSYFRIDTSLSCVRRMPISKSSFGIFTSIRYGPGWWPISKSWASIPIADTAQSWESANPFGRMWIPFWDPLGAPEKGRSAYLRYMEAGIGQERQEELIGGGLIRSVGGWSAVKQLRKQGQDHVMSDERILGDSDFVESVLSQAAEKYERRYELKRRGYDLNRIARRVAEIYGMEPNEIFSKGRQKRKVEARSLLCFWAARDLGMSLRNLARKLELSSPGVGYSIERGEAIARKNDFRLIE